MGAGKSKIYKVDHRLETPERVHIALKFKCNVQVEFILGKLQHFSLKAFSWLGEAHTHYGGNLLYWFKCSVQFSAVQSVAQSCLTLCNPMNRSMPGLPVHHQLPEFTQTRRVHRVSDAIHRSHPLSSPSPPAPNPSQHQSLFQWVNSSHEVAKVLEFQL